MKKNKDPYPITDVYHVTDTLVDGATVVVTDLCDNLSNHINTYTDDILDDIKKINSKNYNSISVSNGADGAYPVWLGVDKYNKVRKIFAETSGGSFSWGEKHKTLVSWSWNKEDMNDQFFTKSKIDQKSKRQKIFDMKITSGAIAIADHGGNFRYEHHDIIKESLDERYFKKDNIYQNNYPIGLFKFEYSNPSKPKPSSFASSSIHDEKVVHLSDYKKRIFIEFLSNLLDETCYPTKYIFQNYIEETYGYRDILELKVSDKKISANDLIDKLPKALKILKKQTKILFKEHFKEVFEIRKKQFEDFIFSIIKDIEPQELDLPTFGKNKIKKNKIENKLTVETSGLPYIQESLYDGYNLKDEPTLEHSVTIPVKNGKYPCYVHTYPDKDDKDEDYQFNYVKIVIEGIEGCYLTRDQKGRLAFSKKSNESSFLKNHINKKSKTITIDQIILKNTETLDELSKIDFVEELQLHGLKNIKNWDGLSKLKNLKRLKLISCDVSNEQSINFFKNLYSLKNLEKFSIDDSCSISRPLKKFPKNLFFKKLKNYEIDFRKEWKKNISEKYQDHQGYGDENLYFLKYHLLQIYRFPNFEKFRSLEVLNIYNMFDEEIINGSYFNYYDESYKNIESLIKNSKNLKSIWLNGFDYTGSLSQHSKDEKKPLEILLNNKKIFFNGKKIEKQEKQIKNLKKIILVNEIQKINNPKLISLLNNEVKLNYFSVLNDKDDLSFFNKCLSTNPEEIVIEDAYQFIRSELMYGDTLYPISNHIKKNKKIKKITFKINNELVDGYGDMDGVFSEWECKRLCQIINEFLEANNKIKIDVEIAELSSQLKDLNNVSTYLRLFELYKILSGKNSFKNKLKIIAFGIISKDINKAVEKYYLEVADTLVVIEDNVGWNDSKLIKNIEINGRFDFEDPNPFFVNLGTKEIKLDYGGVEPHKKESNFLNRMFEDEVFWDYSDENLNHFLNSSYDYDKPIIIVKQKYLNQSNKTIFKNIKHFYYYAQADYSFDEYDQIHYKKFWNENEKFRFPKSVKFNNLETLNVYGGRDFELSRLSLQIDCTNLKQLVLHDCVGSDRSLPYLPNLKTLIIHDKYQAKAKDYNKFSNIKNVEHLEFKNLYNTHDTNGRWQTTEFDFTDIFKLTKLKTLKLDQINPEYLPPIKTLKTLEELKLNLKLITGDMYSDDGTINESLIDKDFEFLKDLKFLKKLKIELPLEEKKIKGSELCSYVNPSIEELNLQLHYEDFEITNGIKFLDKISILKNLKKLILRLGRTDKIEFSEKNKYYYFRKTGEKWNEGELSPRPFILDLKKIAKLKHLEQFAFAQSYRDEMGFKIINSKSITKLKNLRDINIDNKKFDTEDLKYIKKITVDPRDNFLKKCKNKDKSIRSKYSLNEKDKAIYDKLDKEIKFGNFHYYERTWNNQSISEILKERNKKNK